MTKQPQKKNPAARKKHGGGRPTKYQKKYCQEIVDYFSVDVVQKVVDPSGRGGQNTHYEVLRVPSIIGFAAKIGVNQDTLREWASCKDTKGRLKHPEFSVAFARAQSLEDAIVHEYGMAGRLDRGLAALYWTNKLGYRNKSEVEESGEKKLIVETRHATDG